jgi:transcriptional regulator
MRAFVWPPTWCDNHLPDDRRIQTVNNDMSQPSAFREERTETLHALIRSHPLATLITDGADGMIANFVPFILIDVGDKGTLRAHIAKANYQVDSLNARSQTLVIFHGPKAYITPS